MPRVTSVFKHAENEVVRRLMAGRGNVAGIKCLVPVNDIALVPVIVKGINFYHKNYNGRVICVDVVPDGGHGVISVTPAELIDNTPEAIGLFDRKNKAAQFERQVIDASSDRERVTLLVDFRAKLAADKKAAFDELLPDILGKSAEADPVKSLRKVAGDYQARDLAKKMAVIAYELDVIPEWE